MPKSPIETTLGEGRYVCVAMLDTGSFSFVAVDETPTKAREVLRRAWEKHRDQTGARYQWDELVDGVNIIDAELGQAYRDLESMELKP